MNTSFLFRVVVILLASMAFVGAAVSAAETIDDPSLGFTLTLPDGFVKTPDGVGVPPGATHACVLPGPADPSRRINLYIIPMEDQLPHKLLNPAKLPAGYEGKLTVERWNGFEINGFEFRKDVRGLKCVTHIAQVPLRNRGVQVQLFGPADENVEIKELLATTLDGLDGDTNWAPSPEFAAFKGRVNYRLALQVFSLLVIIAGLVVLWCLPYIAPKGTVLAIAVLVFAVGFVLRDVRVQEIAVLSNTLLRIGGLGGLLGVFDLFRKRTPRDENAAL